MRRNIILISVLVLVSGICSSAYFYSWANYAVLSNVALLGTPGLLVAVVLSADYEVAGTKVGLLSRCLSFPEL